MTTLHTFLIAHSEQIVEQWQTKLVDAWEENYHRSKLLNLEQHCASLFQGFVSSIEQADDSAEQELVSLLSEVGRIWAIKGLSASETSKFIVTLKQSVKSQLMNAYPEFDRAYFDLSEEAEQRLDYLLLICHDAYTNGRERLIKQQTAALMELSSPVVKMWEQILLVPLIGVIDTSRARQITESLLTEVARLEAVVAVMDLTGVPVFDTAVAGHLIKTVNAAHMLGCKVIMTGISAEGALVLTKLGIEFGDVVTRGNLHSGVKAAFAMRGLSVNQTEVQLDGF